MESVYLETTFISYLVARPSRDLLVAAHQQATQEWFAVFRGAREVRQEGERRCGNGWRGRRGAQWCIACWANFACGGAAECVEGEEIKPSGDSVSIACRAAT